MDIARLTGQREVALPYDGDVIGAVQRSAKDSATRDIVVCAAGTLPAELHKLWRTAVPGGYHMEYGYSCMGYEIAGGLGVKMAMPDRDVVVMVGDGSYLMLNCRDRNLGDARPQAHRGRARQSRLRLHQPLAAGGGRRAVQQPARRLRAGTLGCSSRRLRRACGVHGCARREREDDPGARGCAGARAGADRTYVICIDTDPAHTTDEGGCWWEVAVPEVSDRAEVRRAREQYEEGKARQS